MINAKKQNLRKEYYLLQDDTAYEMYFKAKLKKAEEDIQNGNVITLQELKQHIDSLEEKYATGNI